MASGDPKRSAAAKKGWETRRRNAAKAGKAEPRPKRNQRKNTYKHEGMQLLKPGVIACSDCGRRERFLPSRERKPTGWYVSHNGDTVLCPRCREEMRYG